MIILILLSLILGGYSLYLIKKLDKETNIDLNNIKNTLKDSRLYLLSELDNKIKSSEELLLNKLKEISNQNQKDNNIKHQQLVSNEFKKLRSDVNKDLDNIVESVKNTKVF
tara:strand:- start:350 stop:682 length:333 start_codon:yes stop_codon:yes gene_type:complete